MKRNLNLDLIRAFATISVISVHFYLNTSYYSLPINGEKMYILTIIRGFFMMCVPLFLILTGYLMCDKKISKEYYYKIFSTLGIYVLASILSIFYKIIVLEYNFTLFSVICSILDFTADGYAWYIEMYIGLFLMILFFNILYNSLQEKRLEKYLLITLFILVVLPTITNFKDYKILSSYWTGLWPILYYFMGMYLKENAIKINNTKIILIFVFVIIFNGVVNIILSNKGPLNIGVLENWYSFENFITSLLWFVFILKLDLEKIPHLICLTINYISKYSLGMYLSSYLVDLTLYPILKIYIPDFYVQIFLAPIIVVLVILLSFTLSYFITNFYYFIEGRLIHKIYYKKN